MTKVSLDWMASLASKDKQVEITFWSTDGLGGGESKGTSKLPRSFPCGWRAVGAGMSLGDLWMTSGQPGPCFR